MNYKLVFSRFFLVGLFISSCNSDENKNLESDKMDACDTLRSADSSNTSAKVFILPAPLQVATTLKILDIPYDEKNIVPPAKARTDYSSSYLKALNLGIYTIDLGYATLYDQRQTSLDYIKSIGKLMGDIGINSSIQNEMVKRFKNNIQKPDSLYKIILESYNNTHAYFQNNQREEMGMFILSGGFIEGLYLSLNNEHIQKKEALHNLIGQQKLFLNNILELLQYADTQADVADLAQKLNSLKEVYDTIEVSYSDSENGKIATKCFITKEQLIILLNKVRAVRNAIVNA